MTTPSGGEKQGMEAMPELRGRLITKEEFGELASQLRDQPYDALNTANNRTNKGSYGEGKSAVKDVHKEMKEPGEHMRVFVAFDSDDKVVGYLAVHTNPNGSIAEAEELRTKLPGHKQRAIAGKVLGAARSYLNSHGYPRLTVKATNESSDFSVVRSGEDFHRFVRTEDAETGEMVQDIPAAANDNFPQAANDNFPAADIDETDTDMREAA